MSYFIIRMTVAARRSVCRSQLVAGAQESDCEDELIPGHLTIFQNPTMGMPLTPEHAVDNMNEHF